MNWIKQHLLMFVGIVVVLVGVVWYGLSGSTAEVPLITTDVAVPGTLAEVSADQEIVGSLLALRSVTLSGTIFLDPAFLSLKDFGTPLEPEPWGRENPFAPIRGSASSSSTPRTQAR